jgi:TP901-1 family phage major tail protein
MSAQHGKDLLLKLGDGGSPETFSAVAGLRAKTISLNARSVDATDSDSPSAWRELMPGAGVKSASISGSGLFKDAASDAAVRSAFFQQSADNWQIVIPDFGVLSGAFLIASLEYSGRFDGEAQYAITLASAGELSFGAT